MKKALIIVDLQQDFVEGGALAVPNASEIVPVINDLIPKFDFIVTTKDYHPKNHCSFKENGGIWPVHCVRGTEGAKIHKDLNEDACKIQTNIFKGVNVDVDSYSAFFDNERKNSTALNQILNENNIKTLYVTGLATDYCVKFTVLDALELGYEVFVVKDACRGVNVNEGDVDKALSDMKAAGAKIVDSNEVVGEEKVKFMDTYNV